MAMMVISQIVRMAMSLVLMSDGGACGGNVGRY